MVKRRTGIDPLAYMGVEPTTPTQFVREGRNPTISDYDNFNIGAVWIVRGTNAVWMLVDKSDFIATWIQFTSNTAGVNTLTGNIGGAVPATAGNINVIGASPYIISGNPGTSTLTLSDNGSFATTYDTDSGSATPAANILNIIGGTGVTVSGAGNTVTIDASSSNLEILTDLGVPVSPDMSILEVYGDQNITTTGIAPNIISVSVSGTTNHAIQIGNASGSLTSVGPLTTGQLLIGVTGSNPNTARLTAGSNITIDDTSTPGEIVISSIGGGGGIIAITKFTSSGTFTKNVNSSYMDVIVWNAGSGGGSGRQGASTAAGGGGGGLAGYIVSTSVLATLFDTTETVTIGAGGIGGAPQTLANTNGNNGTAGGISSIGNIVTLTLGSSPYGGGGTTTNSPTGTPTTAYVVGLGYPAQAQSAAQKGIGTNTNGQDAGNNPTVGPSIVPFGDYICTSGGGGAGADSISERTGGDGGNILPYPQAATPQSIILNTGGAGGVESGTINGQNGNNFISTMGGRIVGSTGGGGGGGQSIGVISGNGGNGGIPCSGGGGGGGSLNGTNSGAGGDGARGEVWIIEYA